MPKKNTTMFILCNPHNPTGRIFTQEELKGLSDICGENNVIAIMVATALKARSTLAHSANALNAYDF